jgi:hypothetical protein
LQQHQQFVEAVVATVAQPNLRGQLESMLQQREKKGWHKLASAIRRILDGERDCDNLCDSEGLDHMDYLIVHRIIQELDKKENSASAPQSNSRFSW